MARSHELIRLRSPLLTESRLISFPPGTEMFQFPGFAPNGLYIQPPVTPTGYPRAPGCPIRTSSDQSLFDDSPKLIAVCHVLHRLCTPRHPPCTLNSLTTLMKSCDHAVPNGLRAELRRDVKKNAPPSFGSVTCALKIPTHSPMNLSKIASNRRLTPPQDEELKASRQNSLTFNSPSHWSRPGSNRQPPRCKRGALPVELRPRGLRQVTPGHIHRGLSSRRLWSPPILPEPVPEPVL
jgi:hypothetical protein